ncbi:MAG TPA: GNAT family N-acetyltransferase [Bryobacteraceae bacterium]|nr:GNAT family N-acetyltransferase [Bryobacteraceae bacterium]
MIVRPATQADLPDIAIIQGPSSWKPADYLEHDCVVGVIDGAVAGFVASREVAPGEREVLYIAVDSAYRRRGVASVLLEHAIKRFPGVWFLEVRESNAAAVRLYESAGFQAVGHRPEYYREPVEAAIVMRFFS